MELIISCIKSNNQKALKSFIKEQTKKLIISLYMNKKILKNK